jgi:hypothetical protein
MMKKSLEICASTAQTKITGMTHVSVKRDFNICIMHIYKVLNWSQRNREEGCDTKNVIQWWVLLNTMMNLKVPYKMRNFFTR